jgi:hypothetical protein
MRQRFGTLDIGGLFDMDARGVALYVSSRILEGQDGSRTPH